MNEVIVYAHGPVSCSVCAPKDMPIDIVTAAVNLMNPTGLSHGWTHSKDRHFADGTPHPAPCNANPNTRLHYLFTC